MTRFLIRLISRTSLICLVITLLALGIGHVLLPEPELLFSASFNLRDLNIYRMSMQRHFTAAVTHDPNNDFFPDWSPDGQHIAYVSDRNDNYTIYVSDAQGGDTHRLLEGSDNQYNPVWSPDSKSIAYINERGGYGGVMLYDMATGTNQALTDTYRTHINPTWSPDGKSVTFVSDYDVRWNTKIYSVNITTKVITPILVGSGFNPVWSSDGRYLLYNAGIEKVNLYLWDSSTQQSSLFYDGSFITNDTPSWSADGKTIIYAAFTTHDNSSIFQLPVNACLARKPECVPQELTHYTALYRSPQWKPSQLTSSQ